MRFNILCVSTSKPSIKHQNIPPSPGGTELQTQTTRLVFLKKKQFTKTKT